MKSGQLVIEQMSTLYSKESFSLRELRELGIFALKVLVSTPHGKAMRDLLLAVVLAQGAALHYAVTKGHASKYLDPEKAGVKDIDIWIFFSKYNGRLFHSLWRQHVDYGESRFGRCPEDLPKYKGRRVDIFGRSIEVGNTENPAECIVRWLNKPSKGSPYYLKQKAIIGLLPEKILGQLIWINKDLV